MKLFDRYLIKRWFLLFVSSLTVLISVYLAGDVAMTIWDLIGKDLPSSKIILHYLLKLPTTFYLIAPVASLLASLLTLTGLKRSGELGALFYSGIGRFRLGVPILAATLLVSFMSLYINDKVAPAANKLSRDIERDASGTTTYLVGTNRIWLLEGKRVVHIRNVENKGSVLIEPTVLIFNSASLQELEARIDAPRAVWHDGRWIMEEGIHRTFINGTVSNVEGPKVIMPAIQVNPEEFSIVKRVPEEMNLRELKGYVRNLKRAGLKYLWYEVRIYRKSAAAFIPLVFGLLALPIGFMVPVRGGVPLGIGMSIIMTLVFWTFLAFFLSMGYSGILPAPVSAWTVNIVFLLLGFAALAVYKRPRLI